MTRIYDLAMTHRLDADDLFIHCVQERCAEARLNFFLIEPLWAETFLAWMQRGAIWSRVLLNMHSEHHQPEEIYHRLVLLAAQQRTEVIDSPERALAACDKASMHSRMMGAGIHVPYTVVIPRGKSTGFRLSENERKALGPVFVIKPSLGYGRRGVILDATGEADLARCEAVWPDDTYLMQRRIVPRNLDGTPGYFRVFHVFGSVWACWWDWRSDLYRLVTPEEMARFALWPLEDIVRRVAAATGMNFFSSEITLEEEGEFVGIDYVNDQCHMLSQSAAPQMGVPDALVTLIANRLVEAAVQMIRK